MLWDATVTEDSRYQVTQLKLSVWIYDEEAAGGLDIGHIDKQQ